MELFTTLPPYRFQDYRGVPLNRKKQPVIKDEHIKVNLKPRITVECVIKLDDECMIIKHETLL